MLAKGLVGKTGVITPEEAFDPEAVFAEMQRRGIAVHDKVEPAEQET